MMREIHSLPVKNYGRLKTILELPPLIEVQKRSYDDFLQRDVSADKRKNLGLQGVFTSAVPISDIKENLVCIAVQSPQPASILLLRAPVCFSE